jgi:COP9 signalosome complex subunit 7
VTDTWVEESARHIVRAISTNTVHSNAVDGLVFLGRNRTGSLCRTSGCSQPLAAAHVTPTTQLPLICYRAPEQRHWQLLDHITRYMYVRANVNTTNIHQPTHTHYSTLTMEQSRALNALAPFLALAKSATSPRAASDLVKQATSAPNTYVFAELLQQPNIRKLASDEQYANYLTLLETFAWGTWESYNASSTPLPALSDAQSRKLRLLSLLTIAAEKTTATTQHNLSYPSLCKRLDLESSRDLEQLVTAAIYDNLITATLNPAAQTVVITSVAPLRDLAPGSVTQLLGELSAWSGRCDSVLADLQAEVAKIETNAVKRAAREQSKDKQIKAATEVSEKTGTIGGTRGISRQSSKMDTLGDGDDEDAMEVDAVGTSNGGRKRSAAPKSGGKR